MKCNICPRNCNVDRTESLGFCGISDTITVARASRHLWEEPCISGVNGSGTVFFSGCNLKCVFCQNQKISRGKIGVELSLEQLCELFIIINNSGVNNINLVTPTHYLPQIAKALRIVKSQLTIPIVYNCSGYENAEMIKEVKDIIDIFLTDIKYKSDILSKKYSCCPDYFKVAIDSLDAMLSIQGKPIIENGLMRSGVIVRHLVLPTYKSDSIDILNALYDRYGNENFLVSLMNQFTPVNCDNFPEINRKLTTFEYTRVAEAFNRLGFKGYIQGKQSASEEYIPDFDNHGEFLDTLLNNYSI